MTDKQETQGQAAAPGELLSRRSFLKMSLGILSAAAAVEVGGGVLLYLQARSKEAIEGGLVDAGAVESIPVGSVNEYAEEGFYLVRDEAGRFLAVSRRCPHLGCNVIWQAEQQQFICPCHASSFDQYGQFESPPVPRPLDIYEVEIADGQVWVNTARVHSRQQFEPGQLTEPQQANASEVGHE